MSKEGINILNQYSKENGTFVRRLSDLSKLEEWLLVELVNKEKECPTLDQFNRIGDLRQYLLLHPDQEMVQESCLHYLGDETKKYHKKINYEKSNKGK